MDEAYIAQQVREWLAHHHFQVETFPAEYGILVRARKASALRTAVGADRALVIRISNDAGVMEVVIRQGSWTKNLVSNAAWLALTGGTNLLISAWSFEVQRNLARFLRRILV